MLEKTRTALALYDECSLEEQARLERSVVEAFAEETSAFNDPDVVLAFVRVGPPVPRLGETELSFLRRMVAKYG